MQTTLKELRARRQVTQREVAMAIGVATSTYNRWETDLSPAAFGKVILLAHFFGVGVGDIALHDDQT